MVIKTGEEKELITDIGLILNALVVLLVAGIVNLGLRV